MFGSFSTFAALATLLASQAFAAPMTNETAVEEHAQILARGGGYPESNPPGVICYNRWEKVTNDVRVPRNSPASPLGPPKLTLTPCSPWCSTGT